ncbi:hypothetical protein ABID95_007418 [Streptomyces atratus]
MPLYGLAQGASQVVPGRPSPFVTAPEPGRTSWTAS